MDREQLIADIKAMSVLELCELVKALEEAIINGNGTGQPKGILKEDVPEGQSVVLAGFALT